MSRCVIIGGAPIKDYSAISGYLQEDDFNIFCDSGLFHLDSLNIRPHLIVGDFDSHPKPDCSVETIVLPREKDDTDTFFAVKEALARGYTDFLLVGVIGGRLDHTLGNVSILLFLHQRGCTATIIDDYSEMEVVDKNTKYIDSSFPYFSLLNIDGTAEGIYERNAKFPLENATITPEFQYGISNEVLPGKTAEVSVLQGRALLMKIRK